MDRRLMTSTETPSLASSSAASRQCPTILECPTMVMSAPSRSIWKGKGEGEGRSAGARVPGDVGWDTDLGLADGTEKRGKAVSVIV